MTAKAELARVKPLAAKNAVSQRDLDDAIGRDLATRARLRRPRPVCRRSQPGKGATGPGFHARSPPRWTASPASPRPSSATWWGPSSAQELTTVSSVNPIKSYINVSEREYLTVRESTKNPEDIPLQITLADGSVYPHKGKLALSDRQIDPTTGTLKIGSLFPNPDNILRPGGYSLVRATMGIRKGALLIPQRSVTDMQGKYLVAVVGADNKVSIRPVKVAERIGSDWIIEEGLKPGEKIVVEGTQKVKPDMVVNPQPFDPEAAAKAAAAKAAAPAQGAAAKPEAKPAAPAPAEKR